MKKRLLSLLLAVVMLLGMMPVSALADYTTGTIITTAYAVTVTNGTAYNAAGEVITRAAAGTTVTVIPSSPSGYTQLFNGWRVETPNGLSYTASSSGQIQFTMPACDVSLIGNYEDLDLGYAKIYLDKCIVGQEADFSATNYYGNTFYSGYWFYNPISVDTEHFYDGVAWYDITDGEYLVPGDVFQKDHTYRVLVGLSADNGYAFTDDLTVDISHVEACTISEDYGMEYSKYRLIESGNIEALGPKTINLQGGTAYNAAGEVITEAMPGDTVTLVADEPDENSRFDMWAVMGVEVEMADINASTTTFIMPDSDITIFSGYVVVTKYAINMISGTAYNAAGEEITEAISGDTVTLVADEPGFGWKFDMWAVMGDTVVEMADINASTTTFVMPESNITIDCFYTEAEKVDVEQLTVTVRGYYIGADVNCLQPVVTGGALLETNSTTNLDYGIMSDNNGMPGTLLTSGKIAQETYYWIGLILTPEFGYTLDNLTLEQVTCSRAEEINITTNDAGNKVLLIKMKEALSLFDGTKKITVTGGTAYNNLTAVTSAYPNLTIRLEAEAPAGQFFSHWEVVSGGITLEDAYSPSTIFTMGSSAVSVTAVYKDCISEIELSIQEPLNTMRPSFQATVPADAGYEVDTETQMDYFVNGVAWMDCDTETYLTSADTFQYGHCYHLQVLLKAKDGEQFSEEIYYFDGDAEEFNAIGLVNDSVDVYTDAYGENDADTLMIWTDFYVYEVEGLVQSWNVSLQDDIAINFVMSLSAEDRVTINGEAVEPVDNGDGTSTVTVHMAAAQMNDELWIDINGTGMSKSYSVRKYADIILANDSYAGYHDLVKYMLAYGGSAQTYFDYNTEDLADSGITVATENPGDLLTSLNVSDSLGMLNFYGASLVFRNQVAVRFYFTGSVEELTFMYNGDSYRPVADENGRYYIEVAGITPQALGDIITVIVSDGADILRVQYSPLDYMIRMYTKENASDSTKAMMAALYNYHLAAVEFIERQGENTVTVKCDNAASGTALKDINLTVLRANNVLEHTAQWYAASYDELVLMESGSTLGIGYYELWVNYAGTEDDSVIFDCGIGQLEGIESEAAGTYTVKISFYFQ